MLWGEGAAPALRAVPQGGGGSAGLSSGCSAGRGESDAFIAASTEYLFKSQPQTGGTHGLCARLLPLSPRREEGRLELK